MAKTSMIEREKKRIRLNHKYGAKRKQLKTVICSPFSSEEERALAEKALQSMPRDASICRQRRRCASCGRSRGNYRLTGLCRMHMRKRVMLGEVPGMHKGSW